MLEPDARKESIEDTGSPQPPPSPPTSASVKNPHTYNLHPHVYADVQEPPPQPQSTGSKFQTPEEDIEEFEEVLRVKENPLDVEEEDTAKKRYKAYRQWLRGKSFFKQSKVDPEWQAQLPVR
jgi:hypothetical protein